jgi:hypothetical protein
MGASYKSIHPAATLHLDIQLLQQLLTVSDEGLHFFDGSWRQIAHVHMQRDKERGMDARTIAQPIVQVRRHPDGGQAQVDGLLEAGRHAGLEG